MPKQSPAHDDSPTQRSERVRSIVDEFLRKRAAGADVSHQALTESHPELLPELAEELRKLALIDDARQTPLDSSLASPAQTDTMALETSLYVRCPHCREAFTGNPESTIEELQCTHCGKTFSLVNRRREARRQRIGRFELIEQLGMGSFGAVWRAWDAQLERHVAVKIPRRKQLDPLDIEEVMREARVAAQLNHPHIVPVHEVGREDDTVYIVSKLIRGWPLHKAREKLPQTFDQSAELCRKVAIALDHAHAQGVIHRDLKPANIMVDEQGEPHLTDFGLAKSITEEISMTLDGHILGTPAYMSPEQARGDASQCDQRSDVYSVGVILYEMLTGEIPFRGNINMIVQQVLEDEPPAPRHLNSYVPRDLETICLKCLQKEPSRRYQSAGQIVDELRRFLDNEPIHARPASSVERAWRFAQRRPALATMIGVCSLLLLVITAGALWGYLHERGMRTELTVALAHEEELTHRLLKFRDFVEGWEKIDYWRNVVEAGAIDPQLHAALRQLYGSKELSTLCKQLARPRSASENLEPPWSNGRDRLVHHRDRASLQHWIDSTFASFDDKEQAEVFACFVQDDRGLQVARSPLGEGNVGNCYAWRAYFHGEDDDCDSLKEYIQLHSPHWPHLEETTLSGAFETRDTNKWVVAISTPVYADEAKEEFLGVLGVFLYVTPPESAEQE